MPLSFAWWGRAMPCRDLEEVTFRHTAKHWFLHCLDNRLMTHLAGHGPAPRFIRVIVAVS
jgi:hypothetical protein